MRNSVSLYYEGIGKDEMAVEAAIADPASDIELIGIPLRPVEVEVLRTNGLYLDGAAPMAFWLWDGRPALFGGMWIDPPGSRRHVVSIVQGDMQGMRLARCLERPGFDVRYVMALRSWEDIMRLKERISGDWKSLEAEGIAMVAVGLDPIENTVYVGVQGLTDEIAATLRARYGEHIVVAEDAPGQAD